MINPLYLASAVCATVVPLYKPQARQSRMLPGSEKAAVVPGGTYLQNLTGSALTTSCYNIDIFVAGVKFNVQVDSGSSDLLIPGSTLGSYSGPTFNVTGKTPLSPKIVGAAFLDTSAWTGKFFYDTVAIDEGAVGVKAGFAVMLNQTDNPAVTDGVTSQGLIGLAYSSISTLPALGLGSQYAATIMDELYNQGAIARDLIAFRSCPANSLTQSVVDWGGSDPTLACIPPGQTDPVIAWAAVLRSDYYTVNVTAMKIGDSYVTLDLSTWQNVDLDAESIVDSCNTVFSIPDFMFHQLKSTLKKSGGFPGWNTSSINDFLDGYGVSLNAVFDFSKMPSLTFTLLAQDGISTIDLIIPSEDYIQQDDVGIPYFIFSPLDTPNVIFGALAFDLFYIVLDRGGKRVGWGLGCDCATKLKSGTRFSQIINNQATNYSSTSVNSVQAQTSATMQPTANLIQTVITTQSSANNEISSLAKIMLAATATILLI